MGLFVTFEGIDGSGKTTQARMLVDRLRKAGRDPLYVREPGGTPLSEAIRGLLLDPEGEIVPFSELMLFSAARSQLVDTRIRPVLREGRPVICDRFYDSTTAYQGGGRAVASIEWLQDLHRKVTGGLRPDRTFFIDVSLEEALRRRGEDDDAPAVESDRMEASGRAFYERVIDAYRLLARREPDRIVRCDGIRTPDEIHGEIWGELGFDRDPPEAGADGTRS